MGASHDRKHSYHNKNNNSSISSRSSSNNSGETISRKQISTTHADGRLSALTRPAPLTVKWPPSAKRFPSLRETSRKDWGVFAAVVTWEQQNSTTERRRDASGPGMPSDISKAVAYPDMRCHAQIQGGRRTIPTRSSVPPTRHGCSEHRLVGCCCYETLGRVLASRKWAYFATSAGALPVSPELEP